MKDHETEPEPPRCEITHGAFTIEAVVVQAGSKTIIQPVEPMTIPAGESFTITRRAVKD